jgi:glycosyltransferase involved in cell wall biosynthesis
MKQIFVVISNAIAGIETYENNLIKLLINNKKKIHLIINKNRCINHTAKYEYKSLYFCDVIWEPLKVLKYIYEIKKKITNEQIIFIINNPVILVFYFCVLKLLFKNKKIIFTKHSHITKISLFQITINFISSFLSNFIDKTIFVSEFTRDWWFKYFFLYKFSKNVVNYNFIYIQKNKKIKKITDNFNIGFIGRLEEEKGYSRFLEIAKKIKNLKLKFFIYGNTKSQKNSNKYFKYCGWKSQKRIYKHIHLLLVTSPVENCPFTVLESKSYSIPTLSISKGGIREIIKNKKDGILLNNETSIKNIEKNIMYIKKNYKFFSKNCYNNSKKFDIKFLEKKIFMLFSIIK